MERMLSVEDKIRRAEEIYYRRQEKEAPARENIRRVAKPKRNVKLLKKMIKQIIVCLIIYGIFYLIVNNNYIFSEDFTQKARELLSQDINFSQIYSIIQNKINEIIPNNVEENKEEKKEEVPVVEKTDDEKVKEEIQNNEENIGGAEELPTEEEQNVEIAETEKTEETEKPELSIMEQDANYIKSKVNFIKPVIGKISSMFGPRNPTTATVPKNHTGTDIAATTGTKIVSATDGTVIFTSSKGDYGKHFKIQIEDVIILYAHCSKLYVKEGDSIKQGQEIAEVGSTGNTTGPHLHFEIRYQDRYVNPQLILEL